MVFTFLPVVDTIPDGSEDYKRQDGQEKDDDRVDHAKEPGDPVIEGSYKIMTGLPSNGSAPGD